MKESKQAYMKNLKLVKIMIDSGIFRNFIDDKCGIIDKPEREKSKKEALKSFGMKESKNIYKILE